MWRFLFICNLLYCFANEITYNTYTRQVATEEEIAKYEANNNSDICLVSIKPCGHNEWRRIDGSCNNLKYPSHGTVHTPEWRMLPANFSAGGGLRKMESGEDYPLARSIRLALLRVGDGIDRRLATSASYFLEYTTADVVSAHDIAQYLFNSHCCPQKSPPDELCVPNLMTDTDNVHRFSGERCINMTAPLTLQNRGCTSNGTSTRINFLTLYFDLSGVYNFFNGDLSVSNDSRTYESGMMKEEVVNNISLPSTATNSTTCFVQDAKETGCLRKVPNLLLGSNIGITLFWRYHNFLAKHLAKLNPCWDDETVFQTARDINIAVQNVIMFDELFGTVLGKENLIRDGILSRDGGFRDIYDEEVVPAMSNEYLLILRWFHNTQDGKQRLYDKYDNFVGTAEMANFSLRVQDLAYNDNMVRLTHGLYNQPAGSFSDRTIHPNMADLGLGPLQRVLDLATNDLAKGRHFGTPSYLQYRDFCTNYEKKHETFEDLEYLMDKEYIDLLRDIYGNDPRNIELMAGSWGERLIPGASVPPTVYCVMTKQLHRSIISDRYWYERPNRPHAFTAQQLEQVQKKSTLASLFCTVGNDVSSIQPHAFLRIGPGNEKVSCEEIPRIDLTPWKVDCCH